MATVIYRCPVGAPGECPTSPTRGYCQVHVFEQLERYDPAQDAPPETPATPVTPAGPAASAGPAAPAAASQGQPRGPQGRPQARRPAGQPAQQPQQQPQQPARQPSRQPVVRLALVIAGALLPVRGEQQRGGGGLAIGRDEPDCAAIPGLAGLDQLSRHHARLRWINGELHVEDLRSTNGTFVDGVQVTGPTRVGPGQRLRFARDIDVQVIEIDEFGAPR
ncbi:FHA domain-containing protein [Kitasatospora sp. NPDC093806]|uniref:FHA domain-containing protein n=1 Tax=Kitasatospora sp. NPDC093806 TaxID=3155075 RepID=UPI00343A4574